MANSINQTVLTKVRQFKQVLLDQNFQLDQVILFGSQITGHEKPWSDIDVGIVSPNLSGDPIKDYVTLRSFSRPITLDLEPHGFTPEAFNDLSNPFVYQIRDTGLLI